MTAHEDRIRDVRLAIVALDTAIAVLDAAEPLVKEAYVAVRHVSGTGHNSPLTDARDLAEMAGADAHSAFVQMEHVQRTLIDYLGRIL